MQEGLSRSTRPGGSRPRALRRDTHQRSFTVLGARVVLLETCALAPPDPGRRATSIDQAIRLHGGERARSRDRFAGLSEADRQALLEFLRAL